MSKLASSIKYNAVSQIGIQIFNLGSSIVLARILGPHEYGIIASILIFISISETFVDGGMVSSIIKDHSADEVDYATVFTLNIAIAVLFYMIIYCSAPYISLLYKESQLTSVSRILGLVVVLNSLRSVQIARLMKELQFRGIAISSLTGVVVSSVIAIILALLGFGVWSLVAKWIIQSIVGNAIIKKYSGWKYRFHISVSTVRKYWRFSSAILLSRVMESIAKQLDSSAISAVYGVSVAGIYSRARLLRDTPLVNMSNIMSRVLFPLYSQASIGSDEKGNLYKSLLRKTALIVWPVAGFMFIYSDYIVLAILGPKWLMSAGLLKIISIYGPLYPLSVNSVNYIMSKGTAVSFAKLEIVKKLMFGAAVAVGVNYNINILLYILGLSHFISHILNIYLVSMIDDTISVGRQIVDGSRGVLVVVASGALVNIVPDLMRGPTGVMINISLYLSIILVMYRIFYRECIAEIVNNVRNVFRSKEA